MKKFKKSLKKLFKYRLLKHNIGYNEIVTIRSEKVLRPALIVNYLKDLAMHFGLYIQTDAEIKVTDWKVFCEMLVTKRTETDRIRAKLNLSVDLHDKTTSITIKLF